MKEAKSQERRPKSAYQKYLTRMLGSAAFIILVIFALVTYANPLWITPTPWSASKFGDYKPLKKQTRTGKCGLAALGKWDGAVIGSSRLDYSIDPKDPSFEGHDLVNLSLPWTNLIEQSAMARWAIENNPELKLLIIGVDHYDMTSTELTTMPATLETTPITPNVDQLEQGIRYHISHQYASLTLRTLSSFRKGEEAEYNHVGFRTNPPSELSFREIFEKWSFPQTTAWIKMSHENQEPVPEKIEALEEIIGLCRAGNIRLILLIPPNHTAYQAAFYIADSPDPTFDQNRRTLVQVCEAANAANPSAHPIHLWDFNYPHEVNGEPTDKHELKWWIDGTHIKQELGTYVTRCLLEGEAVTIPGYSKPYGIRLTTDNIDDMKDLHHQMYEDYRRNNRDDWEWIAAMEHGEID